MIGKGQEEVRSKSGRGQEVKKVLGESLEGVSFVFFVFLASFNT